MTKYLRISRNLLSKGCSKQMQIPTPVRQMRAIHTTPPTKNSGGLSLQLENHDAAQQQRTINNCARILSPRRPIVFTALSMALAFTGAAIATNYETAKYQRRTVFGFERKLPSGLAWMDSSYSLQMYYAMLLQTTETVLGYAETIKKAFHPLPPELKEILDALIDYAGEHWAALHEGQQTCRSLALCMISVQLLHLLPFSRSFALRHFTHDAMSGRVVTLLTGQLGHSGWMHLGSNVIKLLSVGEFTWFALRHHQVQEGERLHEAGSGYHFLAFYLAAGTFASLTSHVFMTRWQLPALQKAFASPKFLPEGVLQSFKSCGASGSISASMAIFVLELLDPGPTVLFFPYTDFGLNPLLFGFVALDAFGLRRGWRKMDHASLIGGAAFGTAYYYAGPPTWDWLRRATDRRPSSYETEGNNDSLYPAQETEHEHRVMGS